MEIETRPVVIIDVPRFCVSEPDADEFIKMYCTFWDDVRKYMIDINGSKRYEFDNRYVQGEFIPTVRKVKSYTDISNSSIRVKQVDRYVLLDEDEDSPYSDELEKIWNPQLEEQEENDETI